MRKIYSLFLLMLLPLLAVAQDNQAISKTHTNYSPTSGRMQEYALQIPYAAAVGHAMPSQVGDSYTIGMWFKQSARNSCTYYNAVKRSVLMGLSTTEHMNLNGNWLLEINADGKFQLDGHGGENNGAGTYSMVGEVSGSPTVKLDTWYYVTFVVDNVNFKAALYLDGDLVKEWATSTPGLFYGPTASPWSDGVFRFADYGFSGAVDEINIYNRALTADEVALAKVNANAVSGMTGYYTLNASTDGTFANEATNAASGTNASYLLGTAQNFWADSGLIDMAYSSATPTFVEGREILPVYASVTIRDGEGGTLSVSDGGNSYVAADDPYTISTGTVLTLTATPADGYKLVGIYAESAAGDIEAEIANGGTYTVVKDITLTARYTNETYALTVNNALNVPYTLTYGGTEVSDLTQLMGGGAEYKLTLNVPESMVLESVQLGTETLTAVDGVYTITLDADATLTINARNKAQYTVTINQPTGGTVAVAKGSTAISSGDKVYENDVLTLSNTKDSGYTFVNYVINGSNTTAETYTVTGDVTISALFEEGLEYCYPEGNATRGDTRGITSLTVSDDQGNTATVTGAGTSGTHALYTDQTSTVFVTKPGATVTIKNNGSGTWMSSYVYVDYDRNGTFDFTAANCAGAKVDGELVSHTGYSGTSSDPTVTCTGSSIDWQASFTLTMPTFVIPEDLAPGNYRIRHKVDWNCVDPCGRLSANGFSDNFMNDNGGGVIDFTIRIESEDYETARTITVASANESLGTVAITDPATSESSISTVQKGVTVKATPAAGYAFLNWTDGDNNVVATTASYIYTGETDVTLTAHFGYAVNFTVGSDGTATVVANGTSLSSGDVVAPGTEVVITLSPADGKNALVELNGTNVTLEGNTFTFTVEEATTIAITFVDQINHITIVTEGNGSVQVWTGYDLDNGNKPAGVQLTTGSIIPTYSDSLDDNMRALECFLIPGTTADGYESISSLSYSIGSNVVNIDLNTYDGFVTMDTDLDIPSDFNEATVAMEIPLADVNGEVTLNVTFTGSTQGIGEIGIDEANGPVEFYNLQGVRVAAENLVPGFYIVRQGNTAKKVFIQK